MTNLEIILSITTWLYIGIWLAVKWAKAKIYEGNYYEDNRVTILILFYSIVFMPIVLIVALIRQFIMRDWE